MLGFFNCNHSHVILLSDECLTGRKALSALVDCFFYLKKQRRNMISRRSTKTLIDCRAWHGSLNLKSLNIAVKISIRSLHTSSRSAKLFYSVSIIFKGSPQNNFYLWYCKNLSKYCTELNNIIIKKQHFTNLMLFHKNLEFWLVMPTCLTTMRLSLCNQKRIQC